LRRPAGDRPGERRRVGGGLDAHDPWRALVQLGGRRGVVPPGGASVRSVRPIAYPAADGGRRADRGFLRAGRAPDRGAEVGAGEAAKDRGEGERMSDRDDREGRDGPERDEPRRVKVTDKRRVRMEGEGAASVPDAAPRP